MNGAKTPCLSQHVCTLSLKGTEQPTHSSQPGQLKKHREDTAKEWAQIPVSGSHYNGQMSGKSKKENNLAWPRAHTHIPVQWGKKGWGHIPAVDQLSGPGNEQIWQMSKYWSLTVQKAPAHSPP